MSSALKVTCFCFSARGLFEAIDGTLVLDSRTRLEADEAGKKPYNWCGIGVVCGAYHIRTVVEGQYGTTLGKTDEPRNRADGHAY